MYLPPCVLSCYRGSPLKSAGEKSSPGPSGDGKGHHYPYDHQIERKHGVGTRLKQVIFNLMQSAPGKREFTQVGSAFTNKQTHARPIQILYIKTFFSITATGLESVFILYL